MGILEILSITGEQLQVEPENMQEVKDESREAMLVETEQAIYRLINSIGMLTKAQLWAYFDGLSQENVSRLLHRLEKDGQVFLLPGQGKDSSGGRYVADSRLADPSYYKVAGNTYASLEKYRRHMESLEQKSMAFWLYLMFRKAGDAGMPVAVESVDFPFILLAFTMMDEIYEVFYIKKGTETDLGPLQAKERYISQDERDTLRRIIMIDDEAQIKDILKFHIHGARCFATIKGDGKFDIFSRANSI